MQTRKAQLLIQEELIEKRLHMMESKGSELEGEAKGPRGIHPRRSDEEIEREMVGNEEQLRLHDVQKTEEDHKVKARWIERRQEQLEDLERAIGKSKQQMQRDTVAAETHWREKMQDAETKLADIETKLKDFDTRERALEEREAELLKWEQCMKTTEYLVQAKELEFAQMVDEKVIQQQLDQAQLEAQKFAITQKLNEISTMEMEIERESEKLQNGIIVAREEWVQVNQNIAQQHALISEREKVVGERERKFGNLTVKRWLDVDASAGDGELPVPIHDICADNSCTSAMEGLRLFLDSDFYCLNLLSHQRRKWHGDKVTVNRNRNGVICQRFNMLFQEEKKRIENMEPDACAQSTPTWDEWIVKGRRNKKTETLKPQPDKCKEEFDDRNITIQRLCSTLEERETEIMKLKRAAEEQKTSASQTCATPICGTQHSSTQTLGPQTTGTRTQGIQCAGTQKSRNPAIGNRSTGTQTIGIRPTKTQTIRHQNLASQTLVTQNRGTQTIHSMSLVRVNASRTLPDLANMTVEELQKMQKHLNYDISPLGLNKYDLMASLTLSLIGLSQERSSEAKALWKTHVKKLRQLAFGKQLKRDMVVQLLLRSCE